MKRQGRIGFDAKRYFLNTTGLGNYSRWVIDELAAVWKESLHLYHPLEATARNTNLKVHNSGKNNRIAQALWRSKYIVKDLQHASIDLYHGLSHEIPQGIHTTKIKTVVTIHDLIQKRYPENYNWIDRRIYNQKIEYAQRVADRIVCPSNQTKRDLVKFYQTDEDKIHVIPIGHSIVSIHSKQPRPIQEPYILCISSFSERKNLVRLCEAFNRSNIKLGNLIIAGKSGSTLARIKRFEQSHSNIKLVTDPSDIEIAALYQHAEFTCYPSLFEGFGIPILESLSYHKTMAVSKRSSLPEVGGKAVLYFDPENVDDMSTSLENLWFSHKQRSDLESNIEEQLNKFETKGLIQKYIDLYSELL